MSDIKVPAVGESITEATIGSWVKKSGDIVKQGEVILSLETDKASVEVVAETDGQLTTTANEGDVVKIGAVVGKIDASIFSLIPISFRSMVSINPANCSINTSSFM